MFLTSLLPIIYIFSHEISRPHEMHCRRGYENEEVEKGEKVGQEEQKGEEARIG